MSDADLATAPAFPGAVGVTHLRVYDSDAPDGLPGGTPHVHLVCTEAYAVAAGRGSVQTLGPEGFEETALEPGSFVCLAPGIIHRLINSDEGLEIFVLMQNSGLPEAGDMVITFPDAILDDATAYRQTATLEGVEALTSGTGEAARRRRDLGVEGFMTLRDEVTRSGLAPLEAFYRRAQALVAPRLDAWRDLLDRGPAAAVRRTGAQLDALARGDLQHLLNAALHAQGPPPAERRMGCCGTLGVYLDPGA